MSSRTDKKNQNQAQDQSNTIKDPDDWTTGEEPMTGAQASYLKTLSEEAKIVVEYVRDLGEELTSAQIVIAVPAAPMPTQTA